MRKFWLIPFPAMFPLAHAAPLCQLAASASRRSRILPPRKKIAAFFSIRRKLGSSGGCNVEDWKFAQQDASEALAKLHFFSIKKKHAHGEVEARITVKEFATAKTTDMKFFAVADIELNQKCMKFQPCGWSETLMGALTECLRNLRKFEYDGPELPTESSADGAQL